MVTVNTTQKFKRKAKVVAAVDLPGVPAGTEGKVYYEAGIRWFRYHVAFENGVSLSNVDGNALVSLADWKADQAEAAREARIAEAKARQAALPQAVVRTGPPSSH
jgi:hypothetical protein